MDNLSLTISFALYLSVLVAIGFATYRFSHNLEDFILAGRRLGPWVVAISAVASDMSGWLLLGLPGEAFRQGLCLVWVMIGCMAGTFFNWTVLAKRLRRYSEILGALTLPDFLQERFRGEAAITLRLASLAVIVVFYTLYIAAQFKAAGKTISSTFPLDYHEAVLLGAAVIIFYTMMGGFFAVAWTDLFQGLLMVLIAVALPLIGIIKIGGVHELTQALAEVKPEMLSVGGGMSGWALWGTLILGGLAWGLGYPGQPHIVVRFMAIEKTEELRRSTLISVIWVVLALYGCMMVGLVAVKALGPHVDDPETVLPLLAARFLPGWLAGVAIAAVAAAIMSTVDSQVLVLTSAMVEDFYRKILHSKASDRLCLVLSRLITLGIGTAAVCFAWNQSGGVFKFVQYAWGGLAAGFGPALIMTLRWKRTTPWGVASGMITGLLTIIIWHNVSFLSSLIWELVPAFCLSMIVIIIVSRLTKPPGPQVLRDFDRARM
jgi:sodium/proline symporter